MIVLYLQSGNEYIEAARAAMQECHLSFGSDVQKKDSGIIESQLRRLKD